jgi:hypothetical protein
MHARPEIQEILIAKKMKRWIMIARHPAVYPHYSASKARRNFWRLIAKHPELATRLGLSVASVYLP